MEVKLVPIDNIIPYHRNPRKNDEAVGVVAKSIEKYGFKVPLVISENMEIITGHTRYRAARLLGMGEIPCILADDLSAKQASEFRLVDNRTAEFSEWDMEKVLAEYREVQSEFMDDLFPHFKAMLDEPVADYDEVTDGEIDETKSQMDEKFNNSVNPVEKLELTCPHCFETFYLDKAFLREQISEIGEE